MTNTRQDKAVCNTQVRAEISLQTSTDAVISVLDIRAAWLASLQIDPSPPTHFSLHHKNIKIRKQKLVCKVD